MKGDIVVTLMGCLTLTAVWLAFELKLYKNIHKQNNALYGLKRETENLLSQKANGHFKPKLRHS